MAAFNPEPAGVPSANIPDFTGASRGAIPDRSFETLFSGLGDMVSGVATLADNSVKNNIETEVRSGFDNLNSQTFESIPPDLVNGASGLGALQTAFDQGKISDTYYYGALNTQLKSLRSKYPGYEDYIDSTMQSVTGVRPANAYRNALQAEITSMQNDAADTQKSWDSWVKSNEQDIIRVFPDYFENPGKYDNDVVRQKTVELKGNEAFIQSENSRINYLQNQGQLNKETATEAATTNLLQTANTFISGQSNALGFDSTDLMSRIAAGTTAGFNEQEYTDIVSQLNVAEATLRTNLLTQMNSPLEEGSSNSYASIIGLTETNKLVDEAMAQFSLIKEMVVNKEYGMATYYTRLNDLRGQRDTSTLLDASPDLRMYNGLSKIDPALAAVWLGEAGRQEGVLNALTPEILARVVQGKDDFNDAIGRIDTSNNTPEEKSSFANSLIDGAVATITSGAATPDELTRAVSSIYAVNSEGKDVFNLVAPEEYSALYQRMFNPSITQALVTSGNKESLETYYTSARNRLQAIPEFRRIAARVQDNIDWSKGITVQFDPTSGRLGVQADVTQSNFNSNGPLGTRGWESVVNNANEAVNELNNVFAIVSPMLDGLDIAPEQKAEVFTDILRDLNVNIENGKQEGFFDWLEKNVKNEIDIFMNSDATKAIGGVIQDSMQQTSDSLFNNVDEDFTFNFDPESNQLVEVNTDATGFEDPSSSPKVNPEVLARFEGRRLPVSIRNNNMGAVSITGDIEDSWAARQPGFVGVTRRPANEGGFYAKYATPEDGVRAASNLLVRYGEQGVNTADKIVRKWSADTSAHATYANTIKKYLATFGFVYDTDVPLDLNNPAIRQAILMAKSDHESGAGRPVYTAEVFSAGVGN